MKSGARADQVDILMQTGLNSHQAAIYGALIKIGQKPAGVIARSAGISRPLAYKALGELEAMTLVKKHDAPGKVAEFSAAHPIKLQDLASERFETARRAKESTESALSALISDFTKISGQPGVRILQGPQGVKDLYADILRERQPIMLIRSPDDKSHPEVAALIEDQIKKQVGLGIHVQAITPLAADTPKKQVEKDSSRLMTRRIIPLDKFSIPAQVIIYANKVSITAFDTSLMTTIIENSTIAQTFRVIFKYLWNAASLEHEVMKQLITRNEK